MAVIEIGPGESEFGPGESEFGPTDFLFFERDFSKFTRKKTGSCINFAGHFSKFTVFS